MQDILNAFQLKGKPLFCQRFGEGHINETYLATCDTGLSYILQKINTNTFKDPVGLMENVSSVTDFLAKNSDDPRGAMRIVRAKDGKPYHVDSENHYWRVYDFVPSSVCLQMAESTKDFYNTGLAFGRFQKLLADFPAETLHESIPKFHDTRDRYRQLKEAIARDKAGRAASCQAEIEFAMARESEAGQIVEALESGRLPWRVTHNDTKLNNILLDYDTHEPLCVIDLDTVMPGSSLYDFGDSIRFGAATAPEDETDLSKVSMSLDLFEVYTKGYLTGCGGSLTELELQMLPIGAKMMTLECGARFLADHLNGDVYFRIHRENHNLDRCRTQFKLVSDMESKMDQMAEIVKKCVK